MTANKDWQQIADHVRELEGEQVKALVLHWLAGTDGNPTEFERLLQAEYTTDEEIIYGEFDAALNFQPLAEEQIIHQSLEALEEYRRTGNGIAHARVQEWVDSLVTKNLCDVQKSIKASCPPESRLPRSQDDCSVLGHAVEAKLFEQPVGL